MTKAFKLVSFLDLFIMICIFLSKYFLMFDGTDYNLINMVSILLPIIIYIFALFVLLLNTKTKSNRIELVSGLILYVLLVVVLLRTIIDSSLVMASVYYPVLLNYYANILVIPTTVYALYILIIYKEKGKIVYVKK